MIIGNNNHNLWLTRETLAGKVGESVAWRSVLGGSTSGNMDQHVTLGNVRLSTQHHGVKVPNIMGINPDETHVYNILEATKKKIGNKSATGLLWQKDDVKLPDSEREVFLRLKNQEQRMKNNPETKKLYCAKFDEYRNKGYIQKLTPEEAVTKETRLTIFPILE